MKIKNLDLKAVYENYLNYIDTITTLYAVIVFTDKQFNNGNLLPLLKVKVPLSTNFSDGYTTIKDEQDIYSCSVSGKLHQINCYQAVVSLVSNFENLINSLILMLNITESSIKRCQVLPFKNEIPSPILKKVVAIHQSLGIKSNMIGDHELQYFYKIILLRNRITHQQGKLKSNDTKLSMWANENSSSIEFNRNHIDSFVHFFQLPISSLITSIDNYLTNKV